ncbi:MAG: hypothetical protein MUE73_20495, partial [Planctomycetes bacterium]|nr:hypothetical protein [Planctomycetota bacterium]
MTQNRNNPDFHAVLYAQVRKTPWWLVSIFCHAFLGFVLNMLTDGVLTTESLAQVASTVTEEILDPLKEEVKPEVEESTPIEEDEVVIEEPMVTDAPVSDHNATENDQPFDSTLGHDDFIGEAPFDGPSTNRDIGIGGGAGGTPGGIGGRRKLRANISGRRSEGAVEGGLEWLKNHQDVEGMWDCDGFMKHDKIPPVCDGAGNAMYDPGVSGLALLAFLGAGETHKHGRYKKTVREGLRYLKQIQDPEGCFGPRTTTHFTYNHAIGALAMAEA